MKVITTQPIIYVDGEKDMDEQFAYAHGEHIKGALKAVGHGIVKGVKAVGHAVVKAEQWVVKESKLLAKGVKKVGGKAKAGTKKLVHFKNKSKSAPKGKDDKSVAASSKSDDDGFKKVVSPITPEDALKLGGDKTMAIGDQIISTVGLDPSKPITLSTDPSTGQKTIGQDYESHEVIALDGDNGNIEYHLPEATGLSTQTKWLIGGGIAALLIVVGIIIYKKNK